MPIFKTLEGTEVKYGPVSLAMLEMADKGIEKEYRDRGEPIDPPTYEVEVAGGGKQTFPHDENSEKSEADELLWQAHVDAVKRMEAEKSSERMLMLMDGVKVDLPDDDAWRKRQKRFRIEIPDDPDELRLHYLTTEVFKSPSDFMDITMEIMRLSARGIVPREAIDAAEATFRDHMEGSSAEGDQTEETE